MKTLTIIIALILSEFAAGQENVSVTITNIPNDEGSVLIGLYTESTFMKAAPDYHAKAEIKDHMAKAVFENIPKGEYAMSVFHDENANQQFDFMPSGRPAESYGTSNNPPSLYGPPLWSDSKFSVNAEPVDLEISLIQY